MYLAPPPACASPRGQAARLFLLSAPRRPLFSHYPPLRSQDSSRPFFFFFNPGCKFLPVSKIDCQIIFLPKGERRGGVVEGGKQKQKRRGGRGRKKRDRGGEISLRRGWSGRGRKRGRSSRRLGRQVAAPPAPPCPRGAALGAGRPLRIVRSLPGDALSTILCVLCLCVRLRTFWRAGEMTRMGRGRGRDCCPARNLSARVRGGVDEAENRGPGEGVAGERRSRPGQCRIVSCVAVPGL